MKSGDVLKIIEQADDLPTLSTVATKVVSVTTGTETSVKEVADLIEKDVALSAKVLQVINSPFYGFARGIRSRRFDGIQAGRESRPRNIRHGEFPQSRNTWIQFRGFLGTISSKCCRCRQDKLLCKT